MAVAGLLFSALSPLGAQGFLPTNTSTATLPAPGTPVLIGQRVPENLLVRDAQGQTRPLLSHKAYLDVMLVAFLQADCPAKAEIWPELRRIVDHYQGWRVAFLAVQPGAAPPKELASRLSAEQIAIPVAGDPDGLAARTFSIRRTPAFLVIDEGGVLRYRGPLRRAPGAAARGVPSEPLRQAMDALIGHVDPVQAAEPELGDGCALAR